MATTDEWAAFASGRYQGWMRAPGGEWEDLIGRVEIACVANADGALDARPFEDGCLRNHERASSTGRGPSSNE